MNKIFSPNMLKTYKECPHKYYLKYVEQISAPQKETPFEKGKKIHALANYYLKGFDVDKLENTLNTEERPIWESLKTNKYFNKEYLNSECNLSCKIGEYWVGGRLDAVVKDENYYYILDYKTGSIPQNPEYDYQTMIYLLSAKRIFKNASKICFIYIDLKNDQNHIIELNDKLQTEYENEIQKICNTIEQDKTFTKTCSKYCEFKKLCQF